MSSNSSAPKKYLLSSDALFIILQSGCMDVLLGIADFAILQASLTDVIRKCTVGKIRNLRAFARSERFKVFRDNINCSNKPSHTEMMSIAQEHNYTLTQVDVLDNNGLWKILVDFEEVYRHCLHKSLNQMLKCAAQCRGFSSTAKANMTTAGIDYCNHLYSVIYKCPDCVAKS